MCIYQSVRRTNPESSPEAKHQDYDGHHGHDDPRRDAGPDIWKPLNLLNAPVRGLVWPSGFFPFPWFCWFLRGRRGLHRVVDVERSRGGIELVGEVPHVREPHL